MQHWYKSDGGTRYGATLKEARAERLLPGVTEVCKIISQPGLERWKQQQLLEAALTLPRLDNEPMDSYINRIWIDSKEYTSQAADLGSAVHDAIEAYLSTGERAKVPKQVAHSFNLAIDWIDEHLDIPTGQVEFVTVGDGYAGRVDWYGCFKDGQQVIIDFKTQRVAKSPRVYSTWQYQLAAYAQTLTSSAILGNLVISTNADNPGVWWRPVKDAYIAWEAFAAALRLWQIEKGYTP